MKTKREVELEVELFKTKEELLSVTGRLLNAEFESNRAKLVQAMGELKTLENTIKD